MEARDRVMNVVNDIVLLAVKGMDTMPGVRPDPNQVLLDVRRTTGVELKSIEAIFEGPLSVEQLDAVAERYVSRSVLVAAASGVAGGLGAPGVAGSIAGLLGTTLGLAHRLALVYGFADALEPGNKATILIGLGSAASVDLLATPSFKALEGHGVGSFVWFGPAASQSTTLLVSHAVTTGLLDEVLGPLLVRELMKKGYARISCQLAPFIGAAVGIVTNTLLLRIWGKRMKAFYHGQHIATLEKLH